MEENKYGSSLNVDLTKEKTGLTIFFNKVYGWMALGVLLTALVAFVMSTNYTMMRMVYSSAFSIIIIMILQFALVSYISVNISNKSFGLLAGLFMVYSFVNGLLFAGIGLAYSLNDIGIAFFATVVPFIGLSAYGRITKRDLSALGKFMLMSLFGLIAIIILNLFIASSFLSVLSSVAGILIFAGLTAYDNNKLVKLYNSGHTGNNIALYGALILYLDFINMFLFVLRLVSRK